MVKSKLELAAALVVAGYVALVAGCALVSHSTRVTLPDGTRGYSINCNGALRDISDCMNEAATVCGGRYHILNGETADAAGVAAPLGSDAVFVRGIHRTMIVSCGPA